jgi:hypothetical protein
MRNRGLPEGIVLASQKGAFVRQVELCGVKGQLSFFEVDLS